MAPPIHIPRLLASRQRLLVGLALLLGALLVVALTGALLQRPRIEPPPWATGERIELHAWHPADRGLVARVVGERAAGQGYPDIRVVEIEDQAPASVDRSGSSAFWTVWRAEPATAEGLLLRALHFQTRARTREGTFFLQVEAFVLARTRTDEREGLLAFVAFDPAERGDPEVWLPDVVAAARQASLLTSGQMEVLRDRQAAHERRVAELLASWGRFAEHPRDEAAGAAFLASLAGVNASQDLRPEEFLDVDQRVALRALGYQIRGRILRDYRGGEGVRYTIVIRDCPLSQLADA